MALGLLLSGLGVVPGRALSPPPVPGAAVDLAAFPLVQPYDLGETSLGQTGVGVAALPVVLNGAIALPPGAAPAPWVVILHGRHGGCHFNPEGTSRWPCSPGEEPRYDLGFAYLAQALAEAGYGVLVPNLNGAFTETFGANADNRNELADQRSGQILDAHLSHLALAHRGEDPGFDIDVTGRVDLDNLVLVGHSMGGGAAALSALQRESRTAEETATGLGPIAALVLVSPTRSYPLQQRPDAYTLPDVPTAVLAGGCDRDIFDLSSLYYAETARLQQRTTPVLALLLPGANHNFFNAAVAEDDYYRNPNNSPLCNPQRSRDRLSRVAQEQVLARLVVAFLGAVGGQAAAQAELGLNPARSAPGEVFGVPVLSQLVVPSAQRYTVFLAGRAAIAPSPGLRLTTCAPFADCGFASRPHPRFLAGLTVEWKSAGDRLTFPLATLDARSFASLDLHLAPDPAWPIPQGQPALAVVLRDRQGTAARVEIPATVPALQPFEADPAHGFTAPLYPSSLRIPLGQFAGVDLANLDSLGLVFDHTPHGRLHLARVEFVR